MYPETVLVFRKEIHLVASESEKEGTIPEVMVDVILYGWDIRVHKVSRRKITQKDNNDK